MAFICMKRSNWLSRLAAVFVVAAVLAAGGAAYWWLANGSDQAQTSPPTEAPQLVRAVRSAQADQPPVIRQSGFVRARNVVALSFQVSGRVATVAERFEVGRRIAEGDVIATLETRRIDTEVARAEAELQRAEAQLMEAEAAYDRARVLENRSVASEAALEDATARRADARAAVSAAEAGLNAARQNREDTTLSAPFDGIVAADSLAPGRVVQPGAEVGRLIGAARGEVYVGLTPEQMMALQVAGGPVGLEVGLYSVDDPDARLRDGRIVNLAPELSDGVRLTNLIVTFADPFFGDPPIQIGQLVRVEIPIDAGDALVAFPTEALRGASTVWEIGDNDMLTRREVDVLHLTDDMVYVHASSLPADTQLLATDLSLLRDGMPVRVARGDRDLAQAQESGE
ncbi:MAG: efflux RND transporter periplasmic adaptor subunit [Pseudomonadota bacterium]